MANFERSLQLFYAQNLSQKKTWYASVAAVYDRARPRYPQALIQQAIALAQLSAGDRVLELSCGPGTATAAFAQSGLELVCLEPSPTTYALAQRNCLPIQPSACSTAPLKNGPWFLPVSTPFKPLMPFTGSQPISAMPRQQRHSNPVVF